MEEAEGRAAYTHKSAGMEVKGTFKVDEEVINLDNALGCSDWYETRRNSKFLMVL